MELGDDTTNMEEVEIIVGDHVIMPSSSSCCYFRLIGVANSVGSKALLHKIG